MWQSHFSALLIRGISLDVQLTTNLSRNVITSVLETASARGGQYFRIHPSKRRTIERCIVKRPFRLLEDKVFG